MYVYIYIYTQKERDVRHAWSSSSNMFVCDNVWA